MRTFEKYIKDQGLGEALYSNPWGTQPGPGQEMDARGYTRPKKDAIAYHLAKLSSIAKVTQPPPEPVPGQTGGSVRPEGQYLKPQRAGVRADELEPEEQESEKWLNQQKPGYA